ncbi:MAG: Rhodanese domain protein [Frankiales bacterium]|nr:Rhodanese domain protein [Frankiales bacterium]
MLPPFVSPAWLADHRADVVLADARTYLDGRSERAAYDAGHLPGAVFVDVHRWLAAPASPEGGRHPLPDPAVFARGMGSLGIGDDDVVVAYDDGGGVTAARLVWMLRVTGHDAALLDGGVSGALVDTPVPDRPPAVFTPRPWPQDLLATLEDAVDPGRVLLDARDRARFRGDVEPVDPRPGHVPGARNVPCRENVGPDGALVPAERLREVYAAVGVTDATDVVVSCGSGVTACHDLLTMEHAGLGLGRLWPGSWSQYSADPARPAALGD